MTVKQLIEELQKYNPDKEVLIQQGEDDDYQYLVAYTVRERIITDINTTNEAEIDAVVIEYS